MDGRADGRVGMDGWVNGRVDGGCAHLQLLLRGALGSDQQTQEVDARLLLHWQVNLLTNFVAVTSTVAGRPLRLRATPVLVLIPAPLTQDRYDRER